MTKMMGTQFQIRLACIIDSTDYWRRGRTLAKLGIGGLGVSELTTYVNEGGCNY
jgi:opine dehydrogenase